MSAFTPAGSAGVPQAPVTLEASTSPVSAQVLLLLVSTEYPVILPIGTKQYLVKLSDMNDLRVAYISGQPGTSVPRGCFFAEGGLSLTSPVTLYLTSTSPNQTAELVVWT